ncbi:MAG TPA: DNA polymerase I [Candidatus Acidoferrales bacterium]|jgi:DNA polymerase-1|nr:DNA polymerase I [Candidatus Acidoferrales bacterium]
MPAKAKTRHESQLEAPELAAAKPAAMKPEARKRLFLVDAMGYIYRAFYVPVGTAFQTKAGVPTKVPYLFATMMRRLFKNKDLRPDYIAVVFDLPAPTFRDKLFASYKAQRTPMPDELSLQLPFVRRYCDVMRLPILEYPGYEADDVIGSLARQATEQGLEVVIVTSDKDLLQLVGDGVRLLNPTKGDLVIDREKVVELMGVPPEQVPDVMALMGDTIDNIPGARDPNEKPAPGERRKAGIGDVGARQLIQQFGSAEEALRRAAEVKRSSYREALEKYGEFVKLSKQLSKIPTDVPVKLSLDALEIREPDSVALREFYTELDFSSLIKELAPVVDERTTNYSALDSPAAFEAFLGAIPAGKEAAVWLSLESEEPDDEGFGTRVLGIEVSVEPGTAHFIANDVENRTLAIMRDWLADPTRPKIVHDPKLFNLLCTTGQPSGTLSPIAGIKHATILYSYLVRPTTANHVFAEVVLRHLNRTLSGAPGEHADFLLRIAPVLRAEVERMGLAGLYDRIDFPLASVLARMECVGVRVDKKELDLISTKAQEEISRLEKSIHELAGFEFKINSPQQLAEVLFDRLGLQMPRRGRFAKGRSTAADVLEELALTHEIPKKVLEYRELTKLKSTYADVLPRLIHPVSGRLHTRFDQTGAVTGRLSSANPNLQNIPIRTELGREIRAAFVASPGRKLLSADYSQIELRILAHLSEDPILVQAFRNGEDIHSRTAQEVFGVLPLEQTREHRRVAKVINFGVIYGLSPFGLAQNLGIDTKEAARFIAAYFERYSGVKRYLDNQIAETRKLGYTKTIFGRIRPMPEITSPQVNLRNFAERTAMNTPMQGAAADLIKLAMIEVDRRLAVERFESKMILQVHDELLFEAPEEEVESLRKLVKQVMEGVCKLRVPLLVETKVGPNWRDMK